MEESKVEIMEKILVKLEDLKNSQESIMEKLGYVQVELFEHPDKELEKQIEEVQAKAAEVYEALDEIVNGYTMKINREKLEEN